MRQHISCTPMAFSAFKDISDIQELHIFFPGAHCIGYYFFNGPAAIFQSIAADQPEGEMPFFCLGDIELRGDDYFFETV